MAQKTRILIVDDHQVVVDGLTAYLETEKEFDIVGCAKNGSEAISLVPALDPDILVLDVSMPAMNGIETVERLKKSNHRARVIVFTMSANPDHVITLFRMGVSAYILKSEPLEEVIVGVKAVAAGATFYSRAVQSILQDHLAFLERADPLKHENDALIHRIGLLSSREREIFRLLADGVSPKDIGNRLYISPKTVQTHKYNIMEKMKVETLAELTKIALKCNLIQI